MPNQQSMWSNDYRKRMYEELRIAIPKGQKEVIAEYAKTKGFNSTREYIIGLILADMELPQDAWAKRPKKPKQPEE